jgi:L-ascorbate metabolism protein UlaG (beta-lactamase superfamily)
MKKVIFLLLVFSPLTVMSQHTSDWYQTAMGELVVTPVNHGSVMFKIDGKVIFVDPYENKADYSKLPKADLILITHEHPDHLDKNAIAKLRKADTKFITTAAVAKILHEGQILKNGDKTVWEKIEILAVPAYNINRRRPDGQFYHPKGNGNGYILSFGKFRVYVAGDTECIPEMQKLGKIDIAFLPKNLPYTMSDAEFIEAGKVVHPKYLYPYHYFELNMDALRKELPKEILLR